MRLHRIRLRNYRGIVESDVSFADSGVTIVEGPNEVGKTAILEALQLAIELPDSSKSNKVRAVKPVDRDQGPEVEIALSTGPYSFVCHKRWLRGQETTLNVSSPMTENHTGREAHDRLHAILEETLDNQLWQALRIEQGAELISPRFSSQSLRGALDKVAGGDFSSDLEDTLWDRIRDEYDKYWTPTGLARNERKSSERRVVEARGEAMTLKAKLEDIEHDTAQMDRLIDEAQRIRTTLADSEKRELDLTEQWESTERLRQEIERLDILRTAAEAERDRAASDWDRRKEHIDNFDTRTNELTAIVAEMEQESPVLSATIRRSEAATASLDAAAVTLRTAEAERDRAVADRDYLRQKIEVAQLRERFDRYLEAEQILQVSERFVESAKVDEDVILTIEQAYLENERAKAAAESAAASVETTALQPLILKVDCEDILLATNEVNYTIVDDAEVLIIQDIARISVNAGHESKDLAERKRNAQEMYERLCAEAGVADVYEARDAEQALRDALSKKDEAVKAIRRDLRDLTPDVLQSKVNNLSRRVTTYLQERISDPPLPTDFEDAQRAASEAERSAIDHRARFDSFGEAEKNARNELNTARINEADRKAKVEFARASKEQALEHLTGARDVQPDQTLRANHQATRGKFDKALDALKRAQGQLNEADPISLESLLKNARNARQRALKENESNRDRRSELRASLDIRGEAGLQSRYDQSLSLLDHAEREHEGREARAEAARLLRDTIEKRRLEAHQRYIGPFKERIDQFGRIVFGHTFSVELDENLRVVRRTLDGKTLMISQLSTGAREQIGVLSRLACAAIVSPDDGGAPVMIDDALGWSDPQRLERMGAAIAVAGEECQVIVLTCVPGRYAHVGNATVVNL